MSGDTTITSEGKGGSWGLLGTVISEEWAGNPTALWFHIGITAILLYSSLLLCWQPLEL